MWRASIRRPDDDEAALDEGQTIEQQSEQDEVLVVNARPERAPTSSTEDAVRPTLSCLILVEVAQNANHETRKALPARIRRKGASSSGYERSGVTSPCSASLANASRW